MSKKKEKKDFKVDIKTHLWGPVLIMAFIGGYVGTSYTNYGALLSMFPWFICVLMSVSITAIYAVPGFGDRIPPGVWTFRILAITISTFLAVNMVAKKNIDLTEKRYTEDHKYLDLLEKRNEAGKREKAATTNVMLYAKNNWGNAKLYRQEADSLSLAYQKWDSLATDRRNEIDNVGSRSTEANVKVFASLIGLFASDFVKRPGFLIFFSNFMLIIYSIINDTIVTIAPRYLISIYGDKIIIPTTIYEEIKRNLIEKIKGEGERKRKDLKRKQRKERFQFLYKLAGIFKRKPKLDKPVTTGSSVGFSISQSTGSKTVTAINETAKEHAGQEITLKRIGQLAADKIGRENAFSESTVSKVINYGKIK